MTRVGQLLGLLVLVLISTAAFAEHGVAGMPTIGVGRITNGYDGTSDAFDLWRFLKARNVKATLVDNVTDSRVVITGDVVSKFDGEEPSEQITVGAVATMLPLTLLSVGTTLGAAPVSTPMEQRIKYSHQALLRVYMNGRQVKEEGRFPIAVSGGQALTGEVEVEFNGMTNAFGAVGFPNEYFEGLGRARRESLDALWAVVFERLQPLLNQTRTKR